MRGALTAVVADNPASCLIGGFKCLSSALRKCRQCFATSPDLQSKVRVTMWVGVQCVLGKWGNGRGWGQLMGEIVGVRERD